MTEEREKLEPCPFPECDGEVEIPVSADLGVICPECGYSAPSAAAHNRLARVAQRAEAAEAQLDDLAFHVRYEWNSSHEEREIVSVRWSPSVFSSVELWSFHWGRIEALKGVAHLANISLGEPKDPDARRRVRN